MTKEHDAPYRPLSGAGAAAAPNRPVEAPSSKPRSYLGWLRLENGVEMLGSWVREEDIKPDETSGDPKCSDCGAPHYDSEPCPAFAEKALEKPKCKYCGAEGEPGSPD